MPYKKTTLVHDQPKFAYYVIVSNFRLSLSIWFELFAPDFWIFCRSHGADNLTRPRVMST